MSEKKILIVHQGGIGDFILSLPALQTLKNAFPESCFELLGYPGTLRLAGGLAETVRSVDEARLSALYGGHDSLPSGVRQYLAGFERIFIFSVHERSAFLDSVRRCRAGGVLHIRTFPAARQHVVDFQLAQLAGAGLAPAEALPRLSVSAEKAAAAERFLRQPAGAEAAAPLVAVHPGSGGRHKCWPPGAVAAAMRRLHEETGAGFFVVQGPADAQAADSLLGGIAGLPHGVLAGLDLPVLAALLASCALFIGNDSGITHMAAALGVPAVAVFGPTDPAVWGPRGPAVRIVNCTGDDGRWQWPEPEAVLGPARDLLGG